MKTLYLVDVSSLFFRAFFAIPPMRNSAGLPTNALYGFIAMTVKLLRDIKPDHIAYCYDRKEPSFRTEIYPEYKANRAEMPEDLAPQIPYVKELTEVLGIPQLDCEGFEADDVIGTLTRKGREAGLNVVIVSGDKDFAQLVGPGVQIYDPMKEISYDEERVRTKWGVSPSQFIDYLAIVGDSSDNIPGIYGVGPKGAQKLLHDFGSLEKIYEGAEKISAKGLKQKVLGAREMAFLSKKLVSIRQDVPLKSNPKDLKLSGVQRERLADLLEKLEFKTFAAKLLNGETRGRMGEESSPEKPQEWPAANVKSWTSEDLRDLQGECEIWGLSDGRGVYLVAGQNLGVLESLQGPSEIFDEKNFYWKGFDLKALWHELNLSKPPRALWDGLLAAYIVHAGLGSELDEIHQYFTGQRIPDLASPEDFWRCHLELERILQARLDETSGRKVYEEIELPLIPVLYSMERHGVRIDVEVLKTESQDLERDLHGLEKKIFQLAGMNFNISSPKQLGQVLFEKLALPAVKRTKTGYSTGSDVLEKLDHPICKEILEYRELSKLKNTYVDALPALVNPETKRIHTKFKQAFTQTGRLSSINPNLQNIPIRTERGRRVRQAFVAGEGCFLLSADYSQIELRLLAHITGDPGLKKAFEEDLDIHAATASEVFGVPLSEVDPELRRRAKAVNFGIAYGQGAFGLSEGLGISRAEAKGIIDEYFTKFPKVAEYMRDIVETARSRGYVETIFGRRRYIEELKSKNQALQKFGERAAINAPLQGSASDVVKKAMIEIHKTVKHPMILQVHDELLFEVPENDIEACAHEVRRIMEGAVQLSVPLRVNLAWGCNWDEAH